MFLVNIIWFVGKGREQDDEYINMVNIECERIIWVELAIDDIAVDDDINLMMVN